MIKKIIKSPPITLSELKNAFDANERFFHNKIKAIYMTSEEYQYYDDILLHLGKKCGHPCKNLTFRDIPIKIKQAEEIKKKNLFKIRKFQKWKKNLERCRKWRNKNKRYKSNKGNRSSIQIS